MGTFLRHRVYIAACIGLLVLSQVIYDILFNSKFLPPPWISSAFSLLEFWSGYGTAGVALALRQTKMTSSGMMRSGEIYPSDGQDMVRRLSQDKA